MNKTFTAALAISAISGLALADRTPATVDTPPAGYADVSTENAFVLNPFTPFDDALTLGDIEGNDGAKLRVIYPNGKKAFEVTWDSTKSPAGWYDGTGCSNNLALIRGQSVQFIGDKASSLTVTMAGVLTNGNASVQCVYGHNFVGNVAPVEKPLTSVSISNFDADSGDYVYVGQKLAYYKGSWYDFDLFRSTANDSDLEGKAITDKQIPAGTGFRVFCAKRYGSKAYPTITLNGSSN